ncbi:hypothetical protein ILUMI_01729 [Ignelater luminosus]|uniref:27 kDa hemolymph protein n=1 Tax=Ignelater luminosus TaxID=2038154 RepID=A0A8K0DE12_IGNLU|nr:hypothetical protein ILUMI_01729 [Ignelater luminosus]
MQWAFATVLLLLGTCWCEKLPENLQNLREKLAASVSLDEVQEALRSKCEKNGGPDAFDKLETAGGDLQTCIQSNFNATQIKEEIAIKRKTGDLDEVFEKYCKRVPTVKECVKTASTAAEACLEQNEKESLKLVLNIADSLATFACYKDGDRIAMFVAEGGPECIESKQSDIERCANETLSHRIPTDISLNNLPLLSESTEGCGDFSKLQTCVVEALEGCEDSTPANIVDALFKFIRRVSPCKDYKPK